MPQAIELTELNVGDSRPRLSPGRSPAVLPAALMKLCVKAW
jgi:hypothetical protein